MEFRILGPLQFVSDDGTVPLGGKRQRAVLAALLLRANSPVSIDALVEELWGERPPPTAAKTVQVYVSRLRKLLPDGRLISESGGYSLHVEPEELDLWRVERLLSAAEAAEPAVSAGKLREALRLFRAAPLPELDFAQAEIARLEELRLTAIEELIEARLTLEEHSQLIPELEQLTEEHPLRERLCGQLMLALYRTARQAEALELFRHTRRRLVEELGIEPGPALQDLELKILNHDRILLPARSDPAEAERIQELLQRGRARVSGEMSGGEELDEARDAALALGDPETAAEAESWLGHLAWVRGDQQGCFAHLKRALALLENRPASKAKALVLGLLARRHMTAADYEQAVRFGRAALVLCTELGDDEGRAESLNTIGTARASSGDHGGLADLDEAIAISRLHERPRALARACLNLAYVLETYGDDMSRIPELDPEGLAAAETAEDAPLINAYRAKEPLRAYFTGHWDDAKQICDKFIAAAERTPHYEERVPRMVRAAIEVGRGEVEAALRDCRRAIQLCRAVRDPQALYPTLGWAAAIFGDAGKALDAESCAEEALELWQDTGLAYPPAAWILGPAFVLSGSRRLAEALAAAGVPTLWLHAAKMVAAGEWARAADLLATTGLRKSEADLRLRAAEGLMAGGQRADADEQLQRALAFYWTAGATLYLRRADELMAVSA